MGRERRREERGRGKKDTGNTERMKEGFLREKWRRRKAEVTGACQGTWALGEGSRCLCG
jgi:hypothetical protein